MPSGDLLVITVECRVAKNDKPYLALTVRLPNEHPVRVRGYSVNAKVWSNGIKKNDIPAPGRVIAADYKEEEFQGEPQLIINTYMSRPKDFLLDAFLTAPIVDQEASYRKLFCFDGWISGDMIAIAARVRRYLEQGDGSLKRKLLEIPAGAKNHHARRAGLLQHIEEIWDFGWQLMDVSKYQKLRQPLASLNHFPDLLDWEIVLMGALLHDLGKINDYNPITLGYDENRESAYLGHTCWGALLVMSFNGYGHDHCFDQERLTKFIHVLLAHHGSTSTGAAVDARVPEAGLLHLLDAMSARMDIHREALIQMRQGANPSWNKMIGGVPITPEWPKP